MEASMRSTLIRSATGLDAREALTAAVLIGAALVGWLITRSPRAVHASAIALRIVVNYCLSTS
jgi:hypothetical protein